MSDEQQFGHGPDLEASPTTSDNPPTSAPSAETAAHPGGVAGGRVNAAVDRPIEHVIQDAVDRSMAALAAQLTAQMDRIANQQQPKAIVPVPAETWIHTGQHEATTLCQTCRLPVAVWVQGNGATRAGCDNPMCPAVNRPAQELVAA